MKRHALFVCVMATLLFSSFGSRAQEDEGEVYDRLVRSMLSMVTLPGGGYVRHCRSAPEGCEVRIGHFATYILVSSRSRPRVDPWTLAAIAFKESAYHPFAIGGVGETGIIQIHPRNRFARRLRFARDRIYRDRCRRYPGACQEEVVDMGAEIIDRAIEICGSLGEGLGMYNRGRCGVTGYSRRVLRIRDTLMQNSMPH